MGVSGVWVSSQAYLKRLLHDEMCKSLCVVHIDVQVFVCCSHRMETHERRIEGCIEKSKYNTNTIHAALLLLLLLLGRYAQKFHIFIVPMSS